MMRSILRLVFLLLLLFAADVAFRTCAAASAAPAAPDSVIVELAPDAAVTPAADWRPVYGQPRTFAVPAATGKRETWAARPDVVRAEPNPLVTLNDPKPAVYDDALILASVNDLFAAQQYSLTKMNVPAAWDASRGDGITIAVVDTGADFAHPDLAAKFVSRGRDFVTGHPDAADDHGHGTHVSGIAAAVTNNGLGVAGVGYNARLLPVKALAANGSGDHASIASAIAWAADNGARIINLSLGSPTPSTTLQTAIDAAWAKGALIVCAAGNDASDQPSYPAAYEHCLSVVATDDIDRLAPFSNYGATVDVAAPGQRILSTVRGGTYEAWSGTSMAAPNVTGVAALVLSAHPDWTPAQVRQALISTGRRVGGAPAPIVDAGAAVGAAPLPMPTVIIPPTRSIPTPTATPAANDYAGQLVALINGARAQAGLGSLRRDARLDTAADFHNRWMRDTGCFARNCPGEPDVFARMRNAAYPVISGGENIGKGYQTPQDMMTGWMNSSGHRAAILNTYWPDIGCAYLRGPSGYAWDSYWSCDFGRAGSGKADTPVLTEPLER